MLKNFLISKMLQSRKFWYAIGSVLIPLIVKYLGVDEETAQTVFYAGISLVIGQGIADSGKK
tara:strand:- start:1920 stop:2105 length:186 start_codon:yes stop_codon:yes gene_type:complete